MDRFDELKMKYQGAINLAKQQGVRLAHVHVQDNKLFIQGACGSEDVKNNVWNQIKLIDDGWQNDLVCDLSIDESLAPPVRTYTVEPGDSLWKIAAHFYGNGAEYPKIIAANPERLKDEKSVIHPGDVLEIPE